MRTVKILKEEVALNPEHLQFTDGTLNDYLRESPVWYSYYSEKHSQAQLAASVFEDRYDQLYSEKFQYYKNNGERQSSDKLAEASARADKDVARALLRVRYAKAAQGQIGGFLKSLDKAIQNALNLGYNKRKEMDKLGKDSIPASKSLEDIMGLPGGS